MLGELMQLQVQRHDDVCITRVRAPALLDAFPQQLAVWVCSSTYPHNHPECVKNCRLGHRRSHPERLVSIAEFGVQAATQVILRHRLRWPVAHLFCHDWERTTHSGHLHSCVQL